MPRRFAMLLLLCFAALLPAAGHAQVVLRNMDLESHWDEYPVLSSAGTKYSSCWAYVHGDGREYAVIGTAQGTAIYNVTDPVNSYPVTWIQGPNSAWRNMKSYREWIYVTSEGTGPLEGMQIISMADPENPTLIGTYTATFSLAHTMHMDTTRALLYVNGTRQNAGGGSYPDVGMRILSLANPAAPVEVGQYGQGGYPLAYVHDSFERGNRLFMAHVYGDSGLVGILDTTNPGAPVLENQILYHGLYTHNVWTDTSGTVLYVTDESQHEPINVFDVSDVMNPVHVNAFTPNPEAILHNVHVLGDELYIAGYSEGVRILDITDPQHPAEFASADSYPGASGGYNGVWETCPYFPSGTVIASDMETGLYVYRPVRDYGIVRVRVQDPDQQPVPGAEVFLSSLNDSLVTPDDGIVQFGPNPGAYTVLAQRFGWSSASANVNVAPAGRDTVTLVLQPKALVAYSGTVRDAIGFDALDEADVDLAYTSIADRTDISGAFAFSGVPDDIYRLETHSPGHVPIWSTRRIGPGFTGPVTIDVPPAPIYDDLESATPWTVGAAGDDAVTGQWVRVEPLGTGAPQPAPSGARAADPGARLALRESAMRGDGAAERFDAAPALVPGDVQPEFDRTPGAGQMCYVTGQGTIPSSVGQADVDAGRTSLTTPAFDLSAMADPHVGWWQWFYSSGDGNDWLAVRVSNDGGATWTDVDTLRGPATTPAWTERTLRVADYVTPSAQVKVRFVAADLGGGSVVESAIDDFIAWDAATVAAGLGSPAHDARLAFGPPRPNPARGEVALTLDLPVAGEVEVALFDVSGRRVRTLHRGAAPAGPLTLRWDGTGASGRPAPAGLYFARARAAGEFAQTRFVRVE